MELEANVRSAFVVVNGIQLIQCRLPTMSEGSCAVYRDASENLQVQDDYGRFEISCLFYLSSDVAGISDHPWIGELVVDDKYCVYLGQVPGGERGPSIVVTKYLPKYPASLEFRIIYQNKDFYRHPEEDLLAEEIQLLLLDQRLFPRGASVPHTNVQSRVENLEVYKRIIGGHYKGKWVMFLTNQDSLSLSQVAGEETRVGLRRSSEPPEQPPHEPHDEEKSDEALLEAVMRILQSGDLTYVELLQKLEQVPAFVDRLNPSHRILFRFLQSHTETFWVKWDPAHTTRVGLIRAHKETL